MEGRGFILAILAKQVYPMSPRGVVSAARSSKPVVNKVVLDYRYRNHSLVAETNEAVSMNDEARDKVTRWLVKESALQRDSYWVELCDRVRRWPELGLYAPQGSRELRK